MFECPVCGGLGLDPTCQTCPAPAGQAHPEEDLVVAEEVTDEPLSLDDDDFKLDFHEDEEDEKVIVNLSETDDDFDLDLGDNSIFDDEELDSVFDDDDGAEDDDAETEFDD
jgi:hypothetical protein